MERLRDREEKGREDDECGTHVGRRIIARLLDY
jgi:hypothetical protein